MALLKQSTAYTRTFKMISSTDHFSLITGSAPVVNISKAGAAFAAAAGAVSETSAGWYKVALTAADSNTLGDLSFYITGTGADDTDFVDQVIALDFAVANVPANVTQLLGTAWLAPGVAGTPDVNAKLWGGTAITASSIPVATAAGAAGGLVVIGTTANTFKSDASANVTFANTSIATVTTVTNQLTAQAIATGVWTDTTAGDFTAALSVGKSVMNGVALGTGLTINAYTGNTAQTGDNFARIGAPAGASVSADVAAIQAKTVNLPAAPASTTNITAGTITTTTNLTNLPAITANWITAAGIADGAIDRATFAADTGHQTVRSNTAQAGAATTITLDASASAVTDFYKNALIVLTGGTGIGQGRYCTAYNGTTKVATVSAWATNPDATSTFAIIAADAIVGATAPTAVQVADEVQTRTIAAVTVVNGLAAGVITAASIAADAITDAKVAADVTIASVTGAVGSVTGAVGSVTGAVGSVTANVNAVLTNGAHGGAAATAQFGGAGGITSTLTGNVTGSVGSVTGAVGSVTGAVGSVTGLTAATVHADLDDIQARLPAALTAGGSIKADVLALNGSTASAANIARSTQAIVLGTVGAASTTTSIVTSSLDPAASVADQYKGKILSFDRATTTAALRGQATDCTASTALGVLSCTALTTAPVSGDTFVIT